MAVHLVSERGYHPNGPVFARSTVRFPEEAIGDQVNADMYLAIALLRESEGITRGGIPLYQRVIARGYN